MTPDKIDIVYLWVDGSDEKWAATKAEWVEKITGEKQSLDDATGAARFRDNGELLHSLRSVAQHAPWVNHIYIITGFGQIPKWLNTNHPKITIVPHEQIMPHDALPTFNAFAIEACIDKIPNLAEHFLLMNDDMFFNRDLGPDFFFDKHGNPIVLYSKHSHRKKNIGQWLLKRDIWTSALILSAKKIDETFGKKMYKYKPSHGIDPYRKSTFIELKYHPLIISEIEKTTRCKFRKNTNLSRWMFNLYDYYRGGVFVRARPPKYGRNKILDSIYNAVFYRRVRMSPYVCANAMAYMPALRKCAIFCINDAQDNTDRELRGNREFLEHRFPNKCEFEK